MIPGEHAREIAQSIIGDLEARGHEISAELRDRATSVAKMASQIYINGLAGHEVAGEVQILEARTQALKAAGASALAAAIIDGLRRAAIGALGVVAGL